MHVCVIYVVTCQFVPHKCFCKFSGLRKSFYLVPLTCDPVSLLFSSLCYYVVGFGEEGDILILKNLFFVYLKFKFN